MNDPGFAAPTGSKLARELLGLWQLPRLATHSRQLRALPRGSETVIVFPGFGTNDYSTIPLRAMLRSLGHYPHGWGFGTNRAEVEHMINPVIEMVERICDRSGKPAALIGWSNGGIFAREVTRDRPDLVSQVFTFGTPIYGGPRYSRGAHLYPEAEIERIESVVNERNKVPIVRPITAFHSQADAVVDWRPCIDDLSTLVDNIEVKSTHAGMLIDPDIWIVIAQRLATGHDPS